MGCIGESRCEVFGDLCLLKRSAVAGAVLGLVGRDCSVGGLGCLGCSDLWSRPLFASINHAIVLR